MGNGRDQGSGIRGQGSGVRDQKNTLVEVRGLPPIPQSARNGRDTQIFGCATCPALPTNSAEEPDFDSLVNMDRSPNDMEAFARAQKAVRLIQEILPIDVRDTAPASVVGALLSVALQHCDSILLLYQTGVNDASAEALIRPMFESVLRLTWVAEDEQRALQVTTKIAKFPKLSVHFQRLDQSSSLKSKTDLSHLHGLTHAGMEQLIQYFSGWETNKPPEREVGFQLAAFLIIVMAFLAGATFCTFTKRTEEIKRIAKVFETYGMGLLPEIKKILIAMIPKPELPLTRQFGSSST